MSRGAVVVALRGVFRVRMVGQVPFRGMFWRARGLHVITRIVGIGPVRYTFHRGVVWPRE